MPRQAAVVPTIPMTFRVPPDTKDRLRRASYETGRTQTDLLCEALKTHLDRLEEEYEALVDEGLALATDEAMADPANQKGKPLEQFRRERGL